MLIPKKSISHSPNLLRLRFSLYPIIQNCHLISSPFQLHGIEFQKLLVKGCDWQLNYYFIARTSIIQLSLLFHSCTNCSINRFIFNNSKENTPCKYCGNCSNSSLNNKRNFRVFQGPHHVYEHPVTKHRVHCQQTRVSALFSQRVRVFVWLSDCRIHIHAELKDILHHCWWYLIYNSGSNWKLSRRKLTINE